MTSPTGPPFQYGATCGYLPAHSGAATPTPTYRSPPPALGHSVLPRRETDQQRIPAQPTPHNCDLGHGGPIFQAPRATGFPETSDECVLQLPLEARNQQWGYVLDRHQLIGHLELLLPLASLVPAPEALTNVTLICTRFDYIGLRAQWSSQCVVYQLFGQALASLQECFARERVFPLEEGRVYYLPSKVFSRAKLSLAPVTTGSLTLLLTLLNPVTLRRLLHRLGGPVYVSLRQLQMASSSLQTLESDPHLIAPVSVAMPAGFELLILNVEHTIKTKVMALRQLIQQTLESDSHLIALVSVAMPAGFDLLTLNVEHTIKTKVMALRQLIQWSGYPAVFLL